MHNLSIANKPNIQRYCEEDIDKNQPLHPSVSRLCHEAYCSASLKPEADKVSQQSALWVPTNRTTTPSSHIWNKTHKRRLPFTHTVLTDQSLLGYINYAESVP